jgi:hypothetical protein
MATLCEYSVVRVKALLREGTHYDGWKISRRPPAVGDIGTIVEILRAPDGGESYVVESTTSDGDTTWLGDFAAEELEPVDDAAQPAVAGGRGPRLRSEPRR